MPTKRQRRVQERRADFTPLRRAQLCQGYDMLSDAYGEGEDFDEAAARADWREHRDETLSYWIQTREEWLRAGKFGFANPPPGGPGTRPWAWWAFDSPPELRGEARPYENIRPVLARHRALLPGEKEA